MNTPTFILIPFPRDEKALAVHFYSRQLGLEFIESDFALPNSTCLLRLRVCEDIRAINSNFIGASLFSAPIATNMLSTCESWLKNGVKIIYMHSDPGGYIVIMADPFGNQFEFYCENWDEENTEIDPFAWDFFRRL